MSNSRWFNMWAKRFFPYSELLVGDVVYWFETKTQVIRWKSEVTFVERHPYTDKAKTFERYENRLGNAYYESRPERGYFIGYRVKAIEHLNVPKPPGTVFPQLGWLKLNEDRAFDWFKKKNFEEKTTLDDVVSLEKQSILELLAEINEKMQHVSPQRIEKVVSATIRKDTKIINTIKKAAHFKCQFSACGHQILKRNGGFYIEVAHIKAVKLSGKSVLGNLVVLCPNHHKEFDHGNLLINSQKPNLLTGTLNGKMFKIALTNV